MICVTLFTPDPITTAGGAQVRAVIPALEKHNAIITTAITYSIYGVIQFNMSVPSRHPPPLLPLCELNTTPPAHTARTAQRYPLDITSGQTKVFNTFSGG